MSREEDKDRKISPSSDSSPWTNDHALVGEVVLQGRALVPITTKQSKLVHIHGVFTDKTVAISSFHPEDARQRLPALWRGLVHNDDSSHPLALDVISSDLTNRTFSLVPRSLATGEERLFRGIYQHVVSEYLPRL